MVLGFNAVLSATINKEFLMAGFVFRIIKFTKLLNNIHIKSLAKGTGRLKRGFLPQ